MSALELLDVYYGSIDVESNDDASAISVSGDGIPSAHLTRTGDCVLRTDIPIGTRHGDCLELIIDGVEYVVVPARGRFSRRSYRVRVDGPDQSWLFTPASGHSQRLVQGERYRGENEIVRLTAHFDEPRGVGGITAEWSDQDRIVGRRLPSAASTPLDCSLGYVLAASFGTGAQFMLPAFIGGALNFFGG